jgi:hypothetical protein
MASRILIALMVLGVQLAPAPPNLVQNGGPFEGRRAWTGSEGATIDSCQGVACFTVRYPGAWQQVLMLPPDAPGKHIVIIARGSAERVLPDGNITGLPYLWAQVLDAHDRWIRVYQGMRLQPVAPDQWGTLHGVFVVPEGACRLRLRLGQAQRRGTPNNGSAARFRDVQVRLFETEADARAFVTRFSADDER